MADTNVQGGGKARSRWGGCQARGMVAGGGQAGSRQGLGGVRGAKGPAGVQQGSRLLAGSLPCAVQGHVTVVRMA